MDNAHYDELAKLDLSYWWFRARYAHAANLLLHAREGRPHPDLTFDYGCGAGGFLNYLRDERHIPQTSLLGYEPAPQAQATLARRNIPLLQAEPGLGPFTRLPRSPDAVSLLDVLEHVAEPSELLAQIHRATQADAILIVLVPAFQHLWTEWDVKLGHHRRYDRKRLHAELHEAGWMVDDSRFLFPGMYLPALARRWLLRDVMSDTKFPRVARSVNAALYRWCRLEGSLPDLGFGTSLAVRAHRRSR